MLDRLAEKNAKKVRIVKVDATKNQKWAIRENVRGVPAFRLYSGGMIVDQFDGAYPAKVMQEKIDRYATTFVSSSEKPKENGDKKEPSIKPMPKNWVPKGVTIE